MSGATSFERSVFVNCPFDDAYLPLLRPLLFTVVYLGFSPRLATERADSGENRLHKILDLIRQSKYSIHDLSRLRASHAGEFSRMNMPFELGLDHGCRVFGNAGQREKRYLILETKRHDFHQAISDLSGVDIKPHFDKPDEIVRAVRNWFVETADCKSVESPTRVWYRFTDFASDFYDRRKKERFTDRDLNMMPAPEYIDFIERWVSGLT